MPQHPKRRWWPACALLLVIVACGTPGLSGTTPSSGAPHELIDLNSSNSLFARLYWDADTASEAQIAGGFLGGGPFSVPDGASLGDHEIQLRRGSESSAVQSFEVTDPAAYPFPAPRLSYLTLYGYEETTAGNAEFTLAVQGADVDVGATIVVDGADVPTGFWKALRYNDGGIDPTSLGYPVYHDAMLLTRIERPIGSSLAVSLRNDGGNSSATETLVVPDADNLDSDFDGLLDVWETDGYDADGDGTVDVNLRSMGADPFHKDIFVEVDFMAGKVPSGDPWTIVENAFAGAPVINIVSESGIHLHIDRGQASFVDAEGTTWNIPPAERDGSTILPQSDYIRFDDDPAPFAAAGETTVNFFDLKGDSANFDPNRLEVFHYGIIADQHGHSNNSSGRGEIWGNDFFVTLSDFRLTNPSSVAGTFMHEFGHNLNLRHGGGDDGDNTQQEPNHLSVMSYFSSDGSFGGSYQVGGVDVDCDSVADGVYDYSRGRLSNLTEGALNENAGICNGVAIDWSGNGSLSAAVSVDISGDAATTLDDFDSWGSLYLNYRSAGSAWTAN